MNSFGEKVTRNINYEKLVETYSRPYDPVSLW